MSTPCGYDHSPATGERDSPGPHSRDGGAASHGPTAVEESPPSRGHRPGFARRMSLHVDADRPRDRATDHPRGLLDNWLTRQQTGDDHG